MPEQPGGSTGEGEPSENERSGRVFEAVTIGVVATVVGAVLVPLAIVAVLAFVAQMIIAGH
jgi:hypothetical protein